MLFLLIPVSHALYRGALTHLKEQKLFQLCSSIDYWMLVGLWSMHSIAFLYANPGGCLNFGDKTLGKQHHKTSTKPPTFPRLVLHGQMIKTARNKLCTSTHKRGRLVTDRHGLSWDSGDQAERLSTNSCSSLTCCRTWKTQFPCFLSHS